MVCKGSSLNFISVLECTPAPVPHLLLVSGTLREQPSTCLDAGKIERNVIIWVGSTSACVRVCMCARSQYGHRGGTWGMTEHNYTAADRSFEPIIWRWLILKEKIEKISIKNSTCELSVANVNTNAFIIKDKKNTLNSIAFSSHYEPVRELISGF